MIKEINEKQLLCVSGAGHWAVVDEYDVVEDTYEVVYPHNVYCYNPFDCQPQSEVVYEEVYEFGY